MNIPPALKETIREGNVILFLGAGASIGATSPEGNKLPLGEELSNLLSKKFLGGEDADQPLAIVAEYAISETDLITVQRFIFDLFEPFKPADTHKLIPTFKWAGIATTNYDLIIERAYEAATVPTQELVPFLSNNDRVDYKLRNNNSVPYLKLHGCISRSEDPDLPLILTVDQYITHRNHRNKLYERLAEYGSQYPIVFVGHSLTDQSLRQILLELTNESLSRPRYYVVTPDPSERQVRLWESKKITALQGTFQMFLEELNREIAPALRSIRLPTLEHPIEKNFVERGSQLSESALGMLNSSVTYLYPHLPTEHTKHLDFYKGYSYGWDAIQKSYDSRRDLEDTILSDTILLDDVDRPSFCEIYLIKGHAGSGKTIIMKRVAWDAMAEYEKLCLFCDSSEEIDSAAIFEILDKTSERLFLFIDKATDHLADIKHLVRTARQNKYRLTIFIASRTNEWNIEGGTVDTLLDDVYEVRYLKPPEISLLIEKLEENNALGLLKNLSREEQFTAFKDRAGRQLLVALHEATMGKPFEDVVFDEYKQIQPNHAKLMYLTVCALNRLGVPVRAGIIYRIHNISFTEFKNKFFGPLESVIFTRQYIREDMAYFSRHPWIAEIVFERALHREDDRFELYLSLIKALDIGYDSDRKAYRSLIKAKNLIELFPNHDKVRSIYDAVEPASRNDAFYFQQRAIYEMKRDNPNLNQAYQLLKTAARLAPNDRFITHSIAELELQRAETSRNPREVEHHLETALDTASLLTGKNAESAHGYHTICKVALKIVREQIETSEDNEQVIYEGVKKAEEYLQKALERFPDDQYLLDIESKLAEIIGTSKKAIDALNKAFSRNPLNPYIARRLSNLHENVGDYSKARDVLMECINELPNQKAVNAAIARLLTNYFPEDGDKAEYHWRRSYTDGDANYNSQFWYARQLWVNGKKEEALQCFERLRSARLSSDVKRRVRGIVRDNNGQPIEYRGYVERLESGYAFLSNELFDEKIFLHRSNVHKDTWDKLQRRTKLLYQLGFTYGGLAAYQVSILRPRAKHVKKGNRVKK